MFQMPQYKNQYGDNWGSLSQFGGTSGYLNSPDVPDIGGGITSQGGPELLTQLGNAGSGMTSGGMFDWLKNSGFTGSIDTKTGIKTDGWGGMALGAAQGLGSAYMGMKQLGMAKDQLAFQKDTFNKNYAAQRQATNTGLQDRQSARVASNSGAYQSVGDYMNQNRIR
jgi:hypothetical protein